MEAHRVCRPVKLEQDGTKKPVTLPDRLATLYLDMRGDWQLPALDGITTGPILAEDGSIIDRDGYDRETRLWCVRVPALAVPGRPSLAEADEALLTLRRAFRTFPFADAPRTLNEELGVQIVDLSKPPSMDESAMLAGLLTAVVRPSIWLAPGLLVTAAAVSGAGSGKGLLIRAICQIAHGIPPRAFTAGSERQELEKRLAAELIEAAPALYLDNVNGAALRSDLLASVLTERPARVRLLGKTAMVPLNSTAFVAVTGNGLSVSEDLARRFLACRLDALTEDPEARPFPGGFLDDIKGRRAELLTAALTIWRWGRQNAADLHQGCPIGSFEQWAQWVRDPLFTLGCADPVLRVAEAKARDPARVRITELFGAWHEHHAERPMKASELADEVRNLVDPQGRGRQFLASQLASMADTRMAGFILSAEKAGGKWSATTYALNRTGTAEGHRDHREVTAR